MTRKSNTIWWFSLLFIFCNSVSCATAPVHALKNENKSLIEVTPAVMEYASLTVKPVIASYPQNEKLTLLLKVSDILIDPKRGIHTNKIKPNDYMVYDRLEKIKLGFIVTSKLSAEQKSNLKAWHKKYMQNHPADVYFAPSADEIIKTKAAFGCSHYARSFIAVVKALELIDKPEDLRYAVSCVAENYNQVLDKNDNKTTINGHQFVMVKIEAKWYAINTSKSEWAAMPEDFRPERVGPPNNIPVQFASYPDVTFLLRKIGDDYDDDCNDGSLTNLMNIYRSGNAQSSGFKWVEFPFSNNNPG